MSKEFNQMNMDYGKANEREKVAELEQFKHNLE